MEVTLAVILSTLLFTQVRLIVRPKTVVSYGEDVVPDLARAIVFPKEVRWPRGGITNLLEGFPLYSGDLMSIITCVPSE